jgi:hypothetical protein
VLKGAVLFSLTFVFVIAPNLYAPAPSSFQLRLVDFVHDFIHSITVRKISFLATMLCLAILMWLSLRWQPSPARSPPPAAPVRDVRAYRSPPREARPVLSPPPPGRAVASPPLRGPVEAGTPSAMTRGTFM